MKRYSSGLYARLGFSVAIHSSPDIVLVDEVLSVGDAAFRRRALEALRRLIAEGKTVLFISHDMWNVRRLCSEILWMEDGRVRAYGAAGEIAERYMNEVNLEALANQATSLQSHRGGTGEVRYVSVDLHDGSGRQTGICSRRRHADRPRDVSRRDSAVERPGVPGGDRRRRYRRWSITTATSNRSGRAGDGRRRRRDRVPVRSTAAAARQYVLRLSITDAHQLASYDVVTAGPRFAVTGQGSGVDSLADEEDGLVSLPFVFTHEPTWWRPVDRHERRTRHRARLGAARRRRREHLLRTGIVSPSARCRSVGARRAAVAARARPGVRARVHASARVVRGPAAAPAARPRGAAARADAGGVSRFRRDRVGADPPRRGARERHHSLARAQGEAGGVARAVDGAPGRPATT